MEYVVSFIFTPMFNQVWLIRKEKPQWQKGCLNGIGGKVEKNENYKVAALRELKEESGLVFNKNDRFAEIGYMEGKNNDGKTFKVVIFAGTTVKGLETKTDEKIGLYWLNDVKNYNYIENVPMLIESCIYYLSGHSNFRQLIMKY